MIMIRSCPDRLEFKNECYSTVNKSISKSNDICINIMVRTKTKPFLKRKKVPKFYFHSSNLSGEEYMHYKTEFSYCDSSIS